MLIFFIWIAWFMILFRVLIDIFRRHDIGGGTKVLWILFVILLPFLGVFVYIITQSHHMAERDMQQAQAPRRSSTSTSSPSRAAVAPRRRSRRRTRFSSSGAITQAEFDEIKRKALAS